MSNVALKALSSKTKAIWALLTVCGSVIAAIISTTIYVNGLIEDVHNLKAHVAQISEELQSVTGRTPKDVGYNGPGFASCDPGLFLTGLSISVDDHFNSRGRIECARVQPIGK